MSDPFVHLRVASGYSLRYGASQPAALVAAAADAEMDTLAITDRDGLYGAVKFARACQRTGIAPVVGVDHTMADGYRAVSLATSRKGWASLCRLTSAVHLAGGVSANRALRKAMSEQLTVPVRFPSPVLCTDNAAMIAAAAHQRFLAGERQGLDFDVLPSWQMA